MNRTDDMTRAEITSRIPSETDLRLLAIDPPDEWLQEKSWEGKTMAEYDVTAYRVFCYQWKCRCGGVNRVGEIIAGRSNECRYCHEKVRIIEYVNDNGAMVSLTTGKVRP